MRSSRGVLVVGVVVGLLIGGAGGFGLAQQDDPDPLPEVAFLASAGNFPDALAASAVAGALGAPVLLTGRAALSAAAAEVLEQRRPDLVVLTGGSAALSARVESDVRALGLDTRRVAGPGRIETAEQLAAFAVELGHGRPVVTGRSVAAGTIPGLDAETVQGFGPDDLQGEPGPPGEDLTVAAVEIDQQRAQEGGVTPGDEPGFPVTIDEPGAYRLASNLVVDEADTAAIEVTASAVTVDLGGFAVLGPVTCTGIPATACSPDSGATGVTAPSHSRIFGGTVQGFGTGVSVGGDSRLWDLVVAHNAGTGVRLGGDGNSLQRSTVVRNGTDGVVAGTVSGFAEVSASTVRGNGQRGISMCGGLVLDSTIHRNGAEGLQSGCVAADVGYAQNAIRANEGNQVSGGRAIGCNVIAGAAVCP